MSSPAEFNTRFPLPWRAPSCSRSRLALATTAPYSAAVTTTVSGSAAISSRALSELACKWPVGLPACGRLKSRRTSAASPASWEISSPRTVNGICGQDSVPPTSAAPTSHHRSPSSPRSQLRSWHAKRASARLIEVEAFPISRPAIPRSSSSMAQLPRGRLKGPVRLPVNETDPESTHGSRSIQEAIDSSGM